jgi:hypothetical protein
VGFDSAQGHSSHEGKTTAAASVRALGRCCVSQLHGRPPLVVARCAGQHFLHASVCAHGALSRAYVCLNSLHTLVHGRLARHSDSHRDVTRSKTCGCCPRNTLIMQVNSQVEVTAAVSPAVSWFTVHLHSNVRFGHEKVSWTQGSGHGKWAVSILDDGGCGGYGGWDCYGTGPPLLSAGTEAKQVVFESGVICGGGRLAVSLEECGTDEGCWVQCVLLCRLPPCLLLQQNFAVSVKLSLPCHYPKHAARHTQRPQPLQSG